MATTQRQSQAESGTQPSSSQERFQQLRRELNKIFLERQAVIDGTLAVLLRKCQETSFTSCSLFEFGEMV